MPLNQHHPYCLWPSQPGAQRFSYRFIVRINAPKSNICTNIQCRGDTEVNFIEKVVCKSKTLFYWAKQDNVRQEKFSLPFVFYTKKTKVQTLQLSRLIIMHSVVAHVIGVFKFPVNRFRLFVDLIQLPSVTGISCGLIPAQRSSVGWISVPSKPSVERMVMTTLLRWEKTRGGEREGEGEGQMGTQKIILRLTKHWQNTKSNESNNQTVYSCNIFSLHRCIYWLLPFVWKLTSACGRYVS